MVFFLRVPCTFVVKRRNKNKGFSKSATENDLFMTGLSVLCQPTTVNRSDEGKQGAQSVDEFTDSATLRQPIEQTTSFF